MLSWLGNPRARAAAVIVLVGASALTGAIARRRHHARTGEWFGGSWLREGWFEDEIPDDEPGGAPDLPDAETIDWCSDGLTPLPGGGCFASPPDLTTSPWPLIVYLHGIFDPAAPTEERSRQARVAELGRAKGFAVLALRGHVGQCSAPEYATRVCWPSNERNQDAGPEFVAEWRAPLRLAALRGARGPRYVLGFSNGGYFAGLLAERGWFDAGAFVVARGGPVEPVNATGAKYPMLLTLSEADPSHDEMIKLDEALTRDDWPHEIFLAQGGHALPDRDIEAAIDFFERQDRSRAP